MKFLYAIAKPIFYVHELCHYFAAKALGVKVTSLSHNWIGLGPRSRMQDILITAAPLVFSLILFCVGVVAAFYANDWRYVSIWLLVACMGVMYAMSCSKDVKVLERHFKTIQNKRRAVRRLSDG